jgi:hypothetical protein
MGHAPGFNGSATLEYISKHAANQHAGLDNLDVGGDIPPFHAEPNRRLDEGNRTAFEECVAPTQAARLAAPPPLAN